MMAERITCLDADCPHSVSRLRKTHRFRCTRPLKSPLFSFSTLERVFQGKHPTGGISAKIGTIYPARAAALHKAAHSAMFTQASQRSVYTYSASARRPRSFSATSRTGIRFHLIIFQMRTLGSSMPCVCPRSISPWNLEDRAVCCGAWPGSSRGVASTTFGILYFHPTRMPSTSSRSSRRK